MKKTLLDFCEIIVDCEHKTAPIQTIGYASIRTPNVGRGRLLLDGVNRVDEATYREWTKRAIPQEKDLIIAREAPVGNVAIIKEGQVVCLGQRTVLVRPDPKKIIPDFLCYFLLGDYTQNIFQGASSGATVKHLNMKDIRAFSMPELPSISTQRRIASILSAYDDLIENNTRRIAILEEMARRLYEEWFVNFRFPGHETVCFVETELGTVPEGWEVGALGSIATINPETIKLNSPPSTIEYIDISSVATGNVSQVQYMFFSDAPSRARRIVKSTDILWSCVRPNLKAYALIVNPNPNTVASTGFAVIRAHGTPYSYVYTLVTSDSFVAYLVNHATGAAYPAVKQSDFEAAKVILPKKHLLSSFHERTEPMLLLCAELKRKNTNLRAQRDLLLPKLISGELDVSEAEDALEETAV